MKVTQEKLPASQVQLEIEIPPETLQKEYDRVVQNLARSTNIPGFRKGKIPRKILIQRMGAKRIKATALEKLIQTSLQEALDREDIQAIGEFQLKSGFDDLVEQFTLGTPLTFAASIDVWPDVKLNQYTDWQLEVEEVQYQPSQVDAFLEERRHQLATLVPMEGRSAQMGDTVTIDFTGRLANDVEEDAGAAQAIAGAKGNDFQLDLADGKFVPGFVEGIVGMNLGETKEVPLTFPKDYPQDNLANQAAVFSITLKELKEKELPDLDDDFAQDVSDFETMEDLRANLESRFRENAALETTANQEKALLTRLVQQTEVEPPKTLVDQEINLLLNQTAAQISRQGYDLKQVLNQETIAKLREESRPEAIKRLQEQLAIVELSKRESIEAEPDAIAIRVQELKVQFAGEKDLDPNKLQAIVEEEELRKAVLKWLGEHSTITWVSAGSLAGLEESPQVTQVEPEPTSKDIDEVKAESVSINVAPTSDVPEMSDSAATPQEDSP